MEHTGKRTCEQIGWISLKASFYRCLVCSSRMVIINTKSGYINHLQQCSLGLLRTITDITDWKMDLQMDWIIYDKPNCTIIQMFDQGCGKNQPNCSVLSFIHIIIAIWWYPYCPCTNGTGDLYSATVNYYCHYKSMACSGLHVISLSLPYNCHRPWNNDSDLYLNYWIIWYL